MVNHIAFIMDGNRRYSKKKEITLKEAYKIGMLKFLDVLKFQKKNKIKNTSFFALSEDNYKKRKKSELKPIFDLIKNFFKDKEIRNFFEKNEFNLSIKGDIENFKEKKEFQETSKENQNLIIKLKKEIEEINSKIKNPKYFAHIALNYDGQKEILNAFKKIIKEKKINPQEITINDIKKNIYFNNIEPPEIIVRPGNAPRLSGFLLFDSQYSEIYFTKKLWPELDEKDFKKIINWYSIQNRNFGK